MPKRNNLHPAEQYIQDVLDRKITVCKWVRLCVERHAKDLKEGSKRGLFFDNEAAQHTIDFFSFLKHSKGEWAGRIFDLEPWQQFIIWMLFGWKRKDGNRRFRIAYIEVGRKNGKSTMLAGIGLYLFFADGEPGAEVYTAATKRDQARITHSEATRMVKKSPSLRKRISIFKDNLSMEEGAAKFEPLGRDSDSMDGLNIQAAIIDELHAHKTRDVWDVIETATGSRRQPMILTSTTAGFNRQTICYEQHSYTEKILEGVIKDDTYFGIIFTVDEGDNWEDESCWIKANPNLGVCVKVDDLRRKAQKAKEMPSALNAFLRLHLDTWTQAETRWLPIDRWNECGFSVDADGLRGRRCYGGLDLSSTIDITAFLLVFPPEKEGDKYQALCRFWVPQDNITVRSRRDRVPYEAWLREGYISATPGAAIDYNFIISQIDEDARNYDLQEIAFDRWGASRVYQQLEDMGMTVIQFGQGYKSMNPPAKELEKMILTKEIAHGGNPVLTWMASNVVIKHDPADMIKPDKSKSIEKIDGITALLMALDRATKHEGPSVYDDREKRPRGIITIGGEDEDEDEDWLEGWEDEDE